jgi:TolB-like protein
LIAVLPFDVRNTKGKMDASARASLEDLLRDEAANTLTSAGWTVLTGENTYALLRDNGIDPALCGEGECHVATARELKVEVFVSGIVHLVDGQFVVSVRIIETKTGRILVSDRIEGATTMELHRAFQKSAADFFARAGLMVQSSTGALAAPPVPVSETGGDSYIFVRASPPEARITIDGVEVHTGRQGPFAAGEHVVRAEAEGFVPMEQKLELVRGTITRASLDLLPKMGKLRITANVSAECAVGELTASPASGHPASLEVPVGSAHVVCHAQDREQARDVSVPASGEAQVAFNFIVLTPPPKPPAAVASAEPPTEGAPENASVPQQALEAPPKPMRPGVIWGSIVLVGAVAIAGGSVAFDNLSPTSKDNRLTAIDFLPVAGYLIAAGLGATGIYGLVAR